MEQIEANKVYEGDTLAVLRTFPDECVDCVITSPPYWGLRSYKTEPVVWDGDPNCQHQWVEYKSPPKGGKSLPDNMPTVGANCSEQMEGTSIRFGHTTNFCSLCSAWRGELGLEPSFQLYIDHLIQIFAEVKRVLKPTGTCWVNIGDSYSTGNIKGDSRSPEEFTGSVGALKSGAQSAGGTRKVQCDVPQKSLVGIPERFALAMTDRLGWVRRNTIIWHKRNCMPSSASDRFTVDFEYVYFFTKSQRYWFEQQFEGFADKRLGNPGSGYNSKFKEVRPDIANLLKNGWNIDGSAIGRNKRCVWEISTQPFKEAHFATFPEKLVEPMILSGCPKDVCKKCGRGREKILEPSEEYKKYLGGKGFAKRNWQEEGGGSMKSKNYPSLTADYIVKGYSDCGCGAGFEGGICLDPFMGSGTTAVVAKKLGRRWVGIELQPEYIKMAERRINNTAYQPGMEGI